MEAALRSKDAELEQTRAESAGQAETLAAQLAALEAAKQTVEVEMSENVASLTEQVESLQSEVSTSTMVGSSLRSSTAPAAAVAGPSATIRPIS